MSNYYSSLSTSKANRLLTDSSAVTGLLAQGYWFSPGKNAFILQKNRKGLYITYLSTYSRSSCLLFIYQKIVMPKYFPSPVLGK